jgi:hypothetical protein
MDNSLDIPGLHLPEKGRPLSPLQWKDQNILTLYKRMILEKTAELDIEHLRYNE